jgi:hypothetical protein
MKKITFIFALLYSHAVNSQNDSLKIKKALLLGTDVLAPISIRSEYLFQDHFGIAIRYYYNLSVIGFTTGTKRSWLIDFNWYPSKIKSETFSLHITGYAKYKCFLKGNSQFTPDRDYNNFIVGVGLGYLFIMDNVYSRVFGGAGINLTNIKSDISTRPSQYREPYDFRLNFSIGGIFYEKPLKRIKRYAE